MWFHAERLKKLWRLWALALGEKASNKNKDANLVAGIRTIVFITYFITNVFIISGVIRHWNECQKKNVSINTAKSFLITKSV